jgi:hypothetical protein
VSATPCPAELQGTALGVAEGLGVLLRGLGALIARAFLRHPRYAAIILPLHQYLIRTGQRFDRVMRALAAGTLRTAKPRPGRPGSGKRPAAFPTQRAWLLAALKHEGAYFGIRIEALLAEPATARLIAATPQAQRLLRPICRMLGVSPAALRKPAVCAASARAPDRSRHSAPPGKTEQRGGPVLPASASPPPAPQIGRTRPASTGDSDTLAHAPGPTRDPFARLCPRLRTRWPFNQLPQFRQG